MSQKVFKGTTFCSHTQIQKEENFVAIIHHISQNKLSVNTFMAIK